MRAVCLHMMSHWIAGRLLCNYCFSDLTPDRLRAPERKTAAPATPARGADTREQLEDFFR